MSESNPRTNQRQDDRPVLCRRCRKPKEANRVYRVAGVHCGCGRPFQWQSVEELEDFIFGDAGYFKTMDVKNKPYTFLGLCLWLDCDRQVIRDICNNKSDEFFTIFRRAREVVELYAEQKLFENRNPAGIIFNLCNVSKQNWVNSQKTESSVEYSLKSALQEIDNRDQEELEEKNSKDKRLN